MYKKGFTLIELIVVLAIIAVLMGLGITGVLNYQNYVQLESAYSDVISALKEIQNKSSNSAIQPDLGSKAPYVYSLYFNGKDYKIYYCEKIAENPVSLNCFLDNNSGITPLSNANNVKISSTCEGMGFLKLSSDMISINQAAYISGNGTINTAGTCIITVSHNISGTSKNINLDLTSNNISLQ